MTESSNTKAVVRCSWANKDPLHRAYHDEEWGIPVHDDIRLFEMLCLAGQQAGLSWSIILKKRNNYRKLFHKFNPYKIAKMTNADVEKLLNDPSILRNKRKIQSIINNARCFLKMEENGQKFSQFIWDFVNNKPIVHDWKTNDTILTQSRESAALSKALKKIGFNYIGTTICYAFMQSVGMVNDHKWNVNGVNKILIIPYEIVQ